MTIPQLAVLNLCQHSALNMTVDSDPKQSHQGSKMRQSPLSEQVMQKNFNLPQPAPWQASALHGAFLYSLPDHQDEAMPSQCVTHP